ncbi:MAG: GlsB/YeaQ/YmgE family stress response membrane protein [Gemmataceae bacterium]
MSEIDLMGWFQQGVQNLMIWIGFGTLAGLAAKAVMPGRDPGGTVATLLTGIVGSLVGVGMLAYFMGSHVSPISLIGFVAAVGGALILLFFYRVLVGRVFREGEYETVRRGRRSFARRRRVTVMDDE